MSRGRVREFPDEDDLEPGPSGLPPVEELESWRTKPEKPRDKPAATHTVYVMVESSDEWERVWYAVKTYAEKDRATHLAEEVNKAIHKELGIKPERKRFM